MATQMARDLAAAIQELESALVGMAKARLLEKIGDPNARAERQEQPVEEQSTLPVQPRCVVEIGSECRWG
jgi:hypothetical protein